MLHLSSFKHKYICADQGHIIGTPAISQIKCHGELRLYGNDIQVAFAIRMLHIYIARITSIQTCINQQYIYPIILNT